MSLAAAILLGAIQGLTEFLPVSSSAHLILARAFFGWEMPAEFGLAFDVALHVGTLAAVLAYFRVEIVNMVRALPGVLSANPDPSATLIRLIVIGTVPAVIAALAFNDFIENVLHQVFLAFRPGGSPEPLYVVAGTAAVLKFALILAFAALAVRAWRRKPA